MTGFTAYDDEFGLVIGDTPALAKVVDADAHEGPVYVADEDALYFTTLPRPRLDAARESPLGEIRRLALDGQRFPLEPERLTVLRAQATRPTA